jgi:DNA-binding response OmpR family regulator
MDNTPPTIKLFIVDDHDTILKMLKKFFERKEGFQVYAFDSGEACINSMNLNPDIIILDYELLYGGGKLNGRDVVDKIQEMEQNPKIIMLTGQENGKAVLELINKGIRDYIIKDENAFTELEDAVDEFIKQKFGFENGEEESS